MSIPQEIRSRLIEPHQRTCPVCGRTNVDLHICHILALSAGGTDDVANLAVMCPTCHSSYDRYQPTELQFTAFLSGLLVSHPRFTDTEVEPRISHAPALRPDITTVDLENGLRRTVLIECKKTAFFTNPSLLETIGQIQVYMRHSRFDVYALAFPGRLSIEMQKVLEAAKIALWDIDFISRTFAEQIKASAHPLFKGLFASVVPVADKTPAIQLLGKLKTCQPGQRDWTDYQRIVGQVLELLFCPPLQAPLSEASDAARVNRRDFVFPNYADAGFWRFLRDMYNADYIVVDAKNYKKPVGKTQVLQVANYLKPHGAGMFGLIVTRKGADNAARLTIREEWMVHRKMILIMDDQTIEAMLLAASAGGDPTKVVGQVIEDFRLSM